MLSRKTKTRIVLLVVLSFTLALIIVLILKALEENVVYFFSPTEIFNKPEVTFNKKIRVGGLVKENSIIKSNTSINFIITDLKNEIIVSYKGLVPNLFSEGKGVVAEGMISDKKYFIADKILAKHDENYMPPEIKESLKENVK